MEGFVLLEKRYLEIKRKRILGLKSLKGLENEIKRNIL